jgi:hypothetical protein
LLFNIQFNESPIILRKEIFVPVSIKGCIQPIMGIFNRKAKEEDGSASRDADSSAKKGGWRRPASKQLDLSSFRPSQVNGE